LKPKEKKLKLQINLPVYNSLNQYFDKSDKAYSQFVWNSWNGQNDNWNVWAGQVFLQHNKDWTYCIANLFLAAKDWAETYV